MKNNILACRFSIPSVMLSEIFMHINRLLTKFRQLKLRGPVIMPHRVDIRFWTTVNIIRLVFLGWNGIRWCFSWCPPFWCSAFLYLVFLQSVSPSNYVIHYVITTLPISVNSDHKRRSSSGQSSSPASAFVRLFQFHCLKIYSAEVIIVPHGIIWSWYTGHWWVSRYIYSKEGFGRAAAPFSPLLAVPNVTAHPSTASVPITV